MNTATTTGPTLIAEDVLLLLFDIASGTFRAEGSPLFHTLAGAVLTDLTVAGRVEIDERTTLRGRLVRAMGDPPADPVLRATWDRLTQRPTDVQTLILQIGPALRATMIDRLVERGDLSSEPHRFLRLIPSTRLVDGGTTRRAELLADVRSVLVDGAAPGLRSGVLAALLSASDALPSLHPEIPWSGAVHTRGRQLQQVRWTAAAAGEAVARTMAAILTNSLFVTSILPATREN